MSRGLEELSQPDAAHAADGRFAGLTVGIWLVSLGLLAAFFALDVRLPQDPGRYHLALPDYYARLTGLSSLPGLWAEALTRSTGWYNLSLASLFRLVGRSPRAFEAVQLGWYALLLASTAGCARRLAGWPAALGALCLTVAMPLVSHFARFPWIHLPEAALAVTVLSLLSRPRALQQTSSSLLICLLGGLLPGLRESGVMYLGPLWLAVCWLDGEAWRMKRLQHPEDKNDSRIRASWRAWTVLLAWGLATLPALANMQAYLGSKVGVRARYAVQVPPLLEQAFRQLGWWTLVPILLGVGLALKAGWAGRLASARQRRSNALAEPSSLEANSENHAQLQDVAHPSAVGRLENRQAVGEGRGSRAIVCVLGIWAILPLPVFLIFRAGIDNYTTAGPALAILASLGLGSQRWTRLMPLLAVGIFWLSGWLPAPWILPLSGLFPEGQLRRDIASYARAYDLYGGPTLMALLEATCAGQDWHSCHVVVEQGLCGPLSEEPGQLELFMLAQDNVELRTVYDVPAEGWAAWRVDALVLFQCGALDSVWYRRSPDAAARVVSLVQALALEPVWQDRAGVACQVVWLTPAHAMSAPRRLPPPSRSGNIIPFSPQLVEASWQAFSSGNPGFAVGQGAASAFGGTGRPPGRPPAFDAEEVGAERRRIRGQLEPRFPRVAQWVCGEVYPPLEVIWREGWARTKAP